MRVLAVVTYSGDTLQCRINLCPELHNYLVEVDKTQKKAKSLVGSFLNKKGRIGDRELFCSKKRARQRRYGSRSSIHEEGQPYLSSDHASTLPKVWEGDGDV